MGSVRPCRCSSYTAGVRSAGCLCCGDVSHLFAWRSGMYTAASCQSRSIAVALSALHIVLTPRVQACASVYPSSFVMPTTKSYVRVRGVSFVFGARLEVETLRKSSEAVVELTDKQCPHVGAFRGVPECISATHTVGWDLAKGHRSPLVLRDVRGGDERAVRPAHGHSAAGASARGGIAQSFYIVTIAFRRLLEQVFRKDGENGAILRWVYHQQKGSGGEAETGADLSQCVRPTVATGFCRRLDCLRTEVLLQIT